MNFTFEERFYLKALLTKENLKISEILLKYANDEIEYNASDLEQAKKEVKLLEQIYDKIK